MLDDHAFLLIKILIDTQLCVDFNIIMRNIIMASYAETSCIRTYTQDKYMNQKRDE